MGRWLHERGGLDGCRPGARPISRLPPRVVPITVTFLLPSGDAGTVARRPVRCPRRPASARHRRAPRRDGRSVGELAQALPISRPAVSRHLRLLKQAGLVVEEAQGTRRIYRLHDAGVEAVRRYLAQVWGDAATRFRIVAENTPEDTDR